MLHIHASVHCLSPLCFTAIQCLNFAVFQQSSTAHFPRCPLGTVIWQPLGSVGQLRAGGWGQGRGFVGKSANFGLLGMQPCHPPPPPAADESNKSKATCKTPIPSLFTPTPSLSSIDFVRECHARSAKFWMSANTRTLVLAPFHKFLVPYQGFFGFPSIWDVAYLNCQPFPPRRGPSTKCTQSTRPGSRRRHCRHCSEPRIRRGGSIRPAEYSSGQIVRAPKPWSTSR